MVPTDQRNRSSCNTLGQFVLRDFPTRIIEAVNNSPNFNKGIYKTKQNKTKRKQKQKQKTKTNKQNKNKTKLIKKNTTSRNYFKCLNGECKTKHFDTPP